jgi:hypothetical protein
MEADAEASATARPNGNANARDSGGGNSGDESNEESSSSASNGGGLRPEDLYPKVLNAAAQCADKGGRWRDALHLYGLLRSTNCYSDAANQTALEQRITDLRVSLGGD